MKKYNFVTGIERGKKRGRKLMTGIVAGIMMICGAAIPAIAAGNGYCVSSANGCENSGANNNSCAAHGAFGAFSDPSQHGQPSSGQPPYFGDDQLGSARGGATGDVNSGFSQTCTAH